MTDNGEGPSTLSYQVIWENAKPKLVPPSFKSEGNSLAAVDSKQLHIDESAPDFSSEVGNATNTINTAELTDIGKEQVVTEINSLEYNTRGKKRKKSKSMPGKADHVYVNTEQKESEESVVKVKQEKKELLNSSYKKRFNRAWFDLPEFAKWLEESPIPGYAYCNVCRKDLQPGKSELAKHASTSKHKKKLDAIELGGVRIKEGIEPAEQRVIDLRSDSVTVPNRDMLEAMKNAVLGDCSFDDDPTVQGLEKRVSKLLGMEAGLFVPNSTMANLICVLTHCWSRGSLVILGDQSCLFTESQGNMAEIGNVSQRVVKNLSDGTFELSDLRNILRMHGPNWPSMTLVCIENTHSMMGGKAVPLEWLDNLGTVCQEYGIPIHMDGTRLINASVALGASLSRLTRHCASAVFCLSKGLGAPGGCVVTGSLDFVQRASAVRKSLGGYIHQGGILAAAGIYVLDHFVPRISKDHSNARAIARAVDGTNSSAVSVDMNNVQTNVIHLICDNIRVNPQQFCDRLAKVMDHELEELFEGISVRCTPIEPNIVRLVTHGDVMNEDVRCVVRKLQFVISEYDNYFVIEYVSGT